MSWPSMDHCPPVYTLHHGSTHTTPLTAQTNIPVIPNIPPSFPSYNPPHIPPLSLAHFFFCNSSLSCGESLHILTLVCCLPSVSSCLLSYCHLPPLTSLGPFLSPSLSLPSALPDPLLLLYLVILPRSPLLPSPPTLPGLYPGRCFL